MSSPAPAAPVVAENTAFGGPTAAQAAAGNTAIANAGGSSSSPLISTSSASRSTTANNVASLNTAVGDAAAGAPGSSTNGGANAQKDTSTGTSVTPGITINTGAAPSSTSGASSMYTYKLANGNEVQIGDPTINKDMLAGATYLSGGSGKDPLAATPTDNGSSSSTDTSAAVSGLPPSLQALYTKNLQDLTDQQTYAKSVLDQAKATLANDPAATAAVQAISDKFDILIKQMTDKNQQVLGRTNSSVAAFGGLGVMSQNFLSNEMDLATQRIATLTTQKQNAILTAQAAYHKQDLSAFNSAMTAYNKTISDMQKSLVDLNNAADKAVTANQAQQRIDATNAKNTVTTEISMAKNLGTSLAKNLSDNGITDPAQQQAYIEQMAQEYGISDPAILQSAVVTAQQTQSKADLAAKNTLSTIAKRNQGKTPTTTKPKVDGSFSYTTEDTATYSNFLNKGGATPDGATYNKRGSDSYVDPGAYIYAYQDWIKQGGTPVGFVKNFPVASNVNPASYSLLPAGIQPKAKVTAAAAPPLPTK